LVAILLRSWTTSSSRIILYRIPFWKLEKGPWLSPAPALPQPAMTGQKSQATYDATMAAWLSEIVVSWVDILDGERSIQLPTALENSIVETVDVIPLSQISARDHLPPTSPEYPHT